MISSLHGKRVLITAGPTREYLDPVRFLTNASSGKMGIELAKELQKRGAQVHLILGPTAEAVPSPIRPVLVQTALQMKKAVWRFLSEADIFIATAAVSDWRFKNIYGWKLKKGSASHLRLNMVRNPDILADAGREKSKKKRGPLLIGFSLESHDLIKNAHKKLSQKNLDLIVANTPVSFSSSHISPIFIDRAGHVQKFPQMTKKKLSRLLVQRIQKILQANHD